MRNNYSLTVQEFDATGYRRPKRLGLMPWDDVQAIVGKTLLEYESARMFADGSGYEFKGRYQGADGGYLTHGATVSWERQRWFADQGEFDS